MQSPPVAATSVRHQQQEQQQQRPPADIIDDVDDIPMPTPVSVLLRTSDDYFSLFEPHEPSSNVDYTTPHHEMPHTTNTLLSSRHRSAPQLATFSRWGSSPSHPSLTSAHMAVIPELEPVSVGDGVEFSSPEQMKFLPHVSNMGTIMLGNSHQSAPQLYAEQSQTFLSGSLTTNGAMIPQTNEHAISSGNTLEEFAGLEDLPLNMDADDWAIGEGFDMDF